MGVWGDKGMREKRGRGGQIQTTKILDQKNNEHSKNMSEPEYPTEVWYK